MSPTLEQLREGAQIALQREDTIKRATLKAKEAAGYLGFSYWKLLELVKAGKGPLPIRVGSRLLFRIETLDSWLSQQEVINTMESEPTGKIRRLK